MTTPPSSPTPSSSSASSGASSDNFSATQWTQQSMLSDLTQQKGLLIGLGAVILAVLFFTRRRSRPEEKAARRLVRDMRHADDADDARSLLGNNLPTILRPALLIVLQEIESQVSRGFDRLEREVQHL